jgi:hypothetical protein
MRVTVDCHEYPRRHSCFPPRANHDGMDGYRMLTKMKFRSKPKEINDLLMETQVSHFLTAKVPPFTVVCKEIHQSHDSRISNPIE